MNLAQLSARLDPSYHLKMQQLQAKFEGDLALADYKARQQAQIEGERREFELTQERQRVESSREIEADRHRYRLEMLDAELSQHMKKLEADYHVEKLTSYDAREQEVFAGAARNIEMRSQLRGELFKQLAGAVINEKLAQKQHARDLEKTRLDHEQKKDARLWDQLCSYIFALLERNETSQAEEYIDRVIQAWESPTK